MKKIAFLLASVIAVVLALVTMAQGNFASKEVYYKDKVIVLYYHQIVTPSEQGTPKKDIITTVQFRDNLKALKDNGYEVISMNDYMEYALHNKPVPDNAVLVTFDDGYESFYTQAYPALKEFSMTATNFIIGYTSDLYNPDAYPHLNWDQMREMKKAGMSFYNHTYNLHQYAKIDQEKEGPMLSNHMYLKQKQRGESIEEYKKRIRSDLAFMNKRLEDELGPQRKLLAFPFGAYNPTVLEVGKELGINFFFTTKEGINNRTTREVFRIDAGQPGISGKDLIAKMKKYH